MNLVKLQGMKSIHRNDLLFYILIMRNQKEKESIPFTIATKRIKYLGINLPKETNPTPALLPGKSHGQRSLVGCSPWGR